jgi:excisionase family DNA binding protein
MDELLNTHDAARVLGVVAGTLEIWRSSGRYGLPFVKIGRNVRYRRADLEAWLAERTRTQSSGQKEAAPIKARRPLIRR